LAAVESQQADLEPIKTFRDSTHAGNRRRERGISVQAMKDVVQYHHKKTQQYRGEHGGFVYRFSKSVGGRTLVVVAEVKKHECWLISAWNT
jgi:hypothetical protein